MFRVGLVLAVLAVATSAYCAPPMRTLEGVKLQTPPTIDGVIDTKVEWARAASGSGFMDQFTGQSAPVGTEFWLAYDEKFIYFAARLQDPDPKSIKANAHQTNVSLKGDDYILLDLDPFGNFSDSNLFFMNARGATNTIISGGRAAKREWLGEFVSKARITAEGWEVEARIPWAIMRLPAAGARTLRVDVMRYYARAEQYYNWCFRGDGNVERVAKWTGVELPKADARRSLKLLPFGYFGGAAGESPICDGGLDVKTSLTDSVEMVGSLNPDFRNIEQQILSLDFSHFERIADDSRPFFMEGASYLAPWQDLTQFMSQSIADFDAGLNVYGKLGEKTSFGILDANTFGESNSFVATVQNAPDHVTSLKASATLFDEPGRHNQSTSLSAYRSWGPVTWAARAFESNDTVRGQGYKLRNSLAYSSGGWFVYGAYQQIDPSFYPALGYVPEVDLKGFEGAAQFYGLLKHPSLRDISVMLSGLNFQNYDGTHYRSNFDLNVLTSWKSGFALSLDASKTRFGGIDEHTYTVLVAKPMNDPYRRWSIGATWGRIQDADYLSPTFNVAFRPLRNLQLNMRYQVVDFMGRSDQAIMTANYDMGHDDGISARVSKQYDSWNAYIAYRRSGNQGAEYYLMLGDPNATSFRTRLTLKVTFPLEIKF